MASKSAKVLPISARHSVTSEREVMLTANLSKTLTGKNLSCMAGFGNPCLCRTNGPRLPNWTIDNPLVGRNVICLD